MAKEFLLKKKKVKRKILEAIRETRRSPLHCIALVKFTSRCERYLCFKENTLFIDKESDYNNLIDHFNDLVKSDNYFKVGPDNSYFYDSCPSACLDKMISAITGDAHAFGIHNAEMQAAEFAFENLYRKDLFKTYLIVRDGTKERSLVGEDIGISGGQICMEAHGLNKKVYRRPQDIPPFFKKKTSTSLHWLVSRGYIAMSSVSGCFFPLYKYRNLMRGMGYSFLLKRGFK